MFFFIVEGTIIPPHQKTKQYKKEKGTKGGVCSIMGNKERNKYVINQIISATLILFQDKKWQEISISEIITKAEVSRNSFYRNFENKEDILKKHLKDLSESWFSTVTGQNDLSFSEKLESIFSHCEDNKVFYQRLNEQGQLYLFKDIMTDSMDLTPDSTAMEAYMKSYIIYMLYGWVETWLNRGMKESAEDISFIFSTVK